jgi:tetratricopeptide (TPR) repeat protein
VGPALAAGAAFLIAIGPAAHAQSSFPRDARETLIAELNAPSAQGAIAQRPFQPLTPGALERLYRAQSLRQSGRLAEARDTLDRMLVLYPHHPQLLSELAHVHGDQHAWGAVDRLARFERAGQRDSVLLGREWCVALTRLGRPRDAVQVAVEVWLAAPAEGAWAEATIARLDGLEPRTAREPLRRAAELRPDRADVVRAAARFEWRHGDSAAALRLLAAADKLGPLTPTRWSFAEDLLHTGAAPDSTAALDALIDLAHDGARDSGYRVAAARRAWSIVERQGAEAEATVRVAHAIAGLPVEQWGGDLGLPIIRALRQGGRTSEARDLLGRLGDRRDANPGLALESALNDLRDSPSEAALKAMRVVAPASPEASFRYAEALFFAGFTDSAATLYAIVAKDPKSQMFAPVGGPGGEALDRWIKSQLPQTSQAR